jgi:hypothetical protein
MEGSVVLQVHRAFSEDSEESDDDGYNSDYGTSDSDEGLDLLSSNIGVMYDHKGFRDPSERLLDFTKAQEYETSRNKYFTPEITKHSITVDMGTRTEFPSSVDLTEFGFPIDRVIGFKVVKAGFTTDATDTQYVDIIINEVPYLACVKNQSNKNIVARCGTQSLSTYLYFENKNIFNNTYFTPIKLPTLTIETESNASTTITALFIEFEITILNTP